MKIIHLSTHDTKGGAARSAYRLHSALRGQDVESRMVVAQKWSDDASVHAWANRGGPVSRVTARFFSAVTDRLVRLGKKQVPSGFDPFSGDRTTYRVDVRGQSDIINLHFTAGFVDVPSFLPLHKSCRLVWRFSDLNPITGGCHYDAGCDRYLTGCGCCPQLGSNEESDVSSAIWRRKKCAFDSLPDEGLHLVAQSNWMVDHMRTSPMTRRFPVTVIHNGVDINVYRPMPRPGLRGSLGIPEQDCVILFAATSTSTRRKGLALLIDAMRGLPQNVWLLSVGGRRPSGMDNPRHIWLGPVESDNLLCAIYNDADIFALPSLQDNFPNTAVESLACGTPVVGFDGGGLRDIVKDGETGRLVPMGDVAVLYDALAALASDTEKRSRMRAACREVAEKSFDLSKQANLLRNIYSDLTEKAGITCL